ncbi:sugar ABC transporter ATP-binding protein [Stakelama saccharophila]|uniref:Sugar ABC transporter ATP-binding protein n=1 Tax=Stakelama saccharophila TaxID=3075605 RepID=A0ABZ0B9L0_9SPHN|nr:sugar ABC transporter ATP-binding protein [Stakelama sp. W311]WNO54096.1 sugar ABC transporter ATP-binding protein [Stakelama sp. W311]
MRRAMVTGDPLLALDGVAKTFPNGTVALAGVDLELRTGRVHGLLGANGAGKSTLIKILSGALPATGGTIRWHGEPVRWTRPRHPREAGVATIYQHIPLVPTLSALENILLDERGAWRDRTADRKRIGDIVAALGDPFDLDAPVAELPIGARQMVSIAQALAGGAELVVMDEPTASLAGDERQTVYRTIRRLAHEEDKAILFVSHFLDEIMALTDEVTVLRDGRAVLHAETDTLDEARIAEAIAGRAVAAIARPDRERKLGEPRLKVRALSSPGKLAPTSFTLHGGEVLGIAGVLGSGRSELMHAVFGSDPDARGTVLLDGAAVGRYPDEAVAAGIALVPEDRAEQGYVPQFTLAENIALARESQHGGAFTHRKAERAAAEAAIARLAIKAPGPDAPITELSGGNAQKVVVAKWLTDETRVLLLDEPTAGIDIGARTDILRLVRRLADDGLPVMLVSSEFEELLAICDRILVMRDGRVIAEADPQATSETDLTLMAGGTKDAAPAGASA